MIIVPLSDTHSMHDRLTLPEGDVLVHAGDATMQGHWEKEVEPFLDWYGSRPHKYKILVAGNHDWCFESNPEGIQQECDKRGIILLNDESVLIEGVRFHGSPVQPWFHDWAFNRKRGAEIKAHWDLIPTDVDVLVTHGPPYYYRDLTPDHYDRPSQHVGCQDLLLAVERTQPQVHIFGHIHNGYGTQWHVNNQTFFVNASVCTERYQPTNPILPIDLEEIRRMVVPCGNSDEGTTQGTD